MLPTPALAHSVPEPLGACRIPGAVEERAPARGIQALPSSGLGRSVPEPLGACSPEGFPGELLEAAWGLSLWRALGDFFEDLGAIQTALGELWGCLGRSWRRLGRCWDGSGGKLRSVWEGP